MEDNNSITRRIGVGTGLIVFGGILVGPAMNGLLQSSPYPIPIPWWVILLLVLGSIAIIMGLLVLIVPPKSWGKIRQMRLIQWFHRTYFRYYLQLRYGLICSIDEPTIEREFRGGVGEGGPRTYYTSKAKISIRKTDPYPIKIEFSEAVLYLMKKVDWRWRLVGFNSASTGIITQTKSEEAYPIDFSYSIPGNDSENKLAVQHGKWGICGIYVTVREKRKELYEGIYNTPKRYVIGVSV